jgi:hypothetical protein
LEFFIVCHPNELHHGIGGSRYGHLLRVGIPAKMFYLLRFPPPMATLTFYSVISTKTTNIAF